MATPRDVMSYFCQRYPYPYDLSKSRLTKMVYLADWRSSLTSSRQLTDIDWEFRRKGPHVHAPEDVALTDPAFTLTRTSSSFGGPKEVIRARLDNPVRPNVTPEEKAVLDHVIHSTQALNYDGFMKLVYSTYPVVTQERYSHLNLPALAKEYQEAGWTVGEPP